MDLVTVGHDLTNTVGHRCVSAKVLLNGLGKAVGAMWDHQSGRAGNHSVIIVKEVLLQTHKSNITHITNTSSRNNEASRL